MGDGSDGPSESSNDGISSLARKAIKNIESDSQGSSKSGTDGISSLARNALKNMDSDSPKKPK